jgi:hypothetical protein
MQSSMEVDVFDDEVTVQVFETSKFLDVYVIDSGKGFEPELIPDPARPDRIQCSNRSRNSYHEKNYFRSIGTF